MNHYSVTLPDPDYIYDYEDNLFRAARIYGWE